MIQTLTIDIINNKALKLLEDLEFLQLIRLHKIENPKSNIDWTKKHKGSIAKQSLGDIENQLNELRSGWE